MEETYKDIKGYEGRYQVSNLGNVYSTPKDGKPNRLLKQEISVRSNSTTYRRVSLSKEGKVTRIQVHRLVAEAFIPNPENKPMVNHIDNNGANNSVTNLEWCTHSENMEHSRKQGRQHKVHSAGGTAAGVIRKLKTEEEARNLIGKTFGNLEIVGVAKSNGNSNRNVFLCQCSCGNPSLVKRFKHEFKEKHKSNHCAECTRAKIRNSSE
jgi:hypothetical protein